MKNYLKIAHRGASGLELENSLSSFKLANKMGADIIELDIQITRDNEFVVFHDYKIDRCTNGEGKVRDFTLKELQSKYLLNNGEQILSLKEFCEYQSKQGSKVIIELKNPKTSIQVYNIVREFLDVKKFIIGSFFHEQILNLKTYDKKVNTCVMFECFPLSVESFIIETKVNYAAIGFESTSKDLVSRIQSKGVKVFVWTVNTKEDSEVAVKMGVDGIISNNIHLL